MTMTMHDYLRQQCEEMLLLERGNMQLSDEMIQDSRNTWLVDMLKNQRVLISQRIDNLSTLVQILGGKLSAVNERVAVDPLLAYHQWKTAKPSQDVLDLHNASTSASIFQQGLPFYQNIAHLARELEIDEVSLTVERFITDQQDYLRKLREGMLALVAQLTAQSKKAA